MLRFNRLNLKNLSKLPRDFSTAQPLNKNFAQRFQEFSVAYKESASMAINILGAISAICVGFATYSYFFEKFEAQRAHSLVLEAMLKSQEKLADERLKMADERLKAQEKVADEKFKTTEEKLKAEALLLEEKFHSQQEKLKAEALLLEEKLQAQKNLADEKLRAQEKLFEEKLKSITGKSATPPSI